MKGVILHFDTEIYLILTNECLHSHTAPQQTNQKKRGVISLHQNYKLQIINCISVIACPTKSYLALFLTFCHMTTYSNDMPHVSKAIDLSMCF